MSVAILMPTKDEAARLVRTLEAVRACAISMGDVTVFVVDDGSAPPVMPAGLPTPTPSFRIVLARHPVNLGQGAALETARQLAFDRGKFDVYVTMDSDGQHAAEDAVALVRAVEAGADVAFGNRFLGGSAVPPARRAVLHAARLFERILTGLRLADAHNGLRAFSRRGVAAVAIRQNRMAHATEITQRVARARSLDLTLVEVPVTVRYTRETSAKGQRASGAALILRDLLGQYLFGEAE
jgi:glycosyltransferase involved in cell wall biosynthesis